jgi:hypothetical protein
VRRTRGRCCDTNLEPWEEREMRDALPSPPPVLITVNKPRIYSDCEAFLQHSERNWIYLFRLIVLGLGQSRRSEISNCFKELV